MILSNGVELFHGSYTAVTNPDLNKCEEGKDFGKGFYVTTDEAQARRFVKSAVGKAVKNGIIIANPDLGYISKFDYLGIKGLKVHVFEDADRAWLHCVASHRKKGLLAYEVNKWQDYDIIAGKIANDNTNQVITAYINGLYGEIGSETADRTAISLLMPERLTDQICFRTEKALKSIKFVGDEPVTIQR